MEKQTKCYKCNSLIDIDDNKLVVYSEDKKKVILYVLCSLCRQTFQALCQWCTEPIFEASVYDVKCFWNRGFSGYPICLKCIGSFKYGKQTTNNEDRIRLGLKPEIPNKQCKTCDIAKCNNNFNNCVRIQNKKRGLDKWL